MLLFKLKLGELAIKEFRKDKGETIRGRKGRSCHQPPLRARIITFHNVLLKEDGRRGGSATEDEGKKEFT